MDFRDQVAPHLRYVIAESGVNPREIKRYLNAYTLGTKIKPNLDPKVTLALQTIAFRRDWEAVRRAVLSHHDIFVDALRRRVVDHDFTAITDLDPTLTGIPESFFNYVSAPNPGFVLLNTQNLDEYIYSGEATRSSLSALFLDAIRDVAQLTKKLRQLQSAVTLDANTISPYSSSVSSALSVVQQAGGSRFVGIAKEWTDHVTVAGSQLQAGANNDTIKKQWLADEETFIRRVLNQLMETYWTGAP